MFSTAFHRVNLGCGVLSAHPICGDFPRGGLVSLSLHSPVSLAQFVRGREGGDEQIHIVLQILKTRLEIHV